MHPPDLLALFVKPLETNKNRYFLTGSVASSFYGEPRLTHDVDLVVHLSSSEISNFVELFPSESFYCPPIDVIEIEMRRKPFGHFNLIHPQTGLKADVYLDVGDKLHAWAFEHRKRIDLNSEFSLWLAPPEYVIIRKLEFFREGGSDKHAEDIRKMLLQKPSLTTAFIENEINARGLNSFWAKCKL